VPNRLTVRQGINLRVLARVLFDPAQARERVDAVDVHGTRSADTLAARSAEGERGVDLVLDLDLWGEARTWTRRRT
jgi:hypothetical protein